MRPIVPTFIKHAHIFFVRLVDEILPFEGMKSKGVEDSSHRMQSAFTELLI